MPHYCSISHINIEISNSYRMTNSTHLKLERPKTLSKLEELIIYYGIIKINV